MSKKLVILASFGLLLAALIIVVYVFVLSDSKSIEAKPNTTTRLVAKHP